METYRKFVAGGKLMHEKLSHVTATGSISIRHLNKFIITADNANLYALTHDELVEIADYDPVRDSILAIGRAYPSVETPVHWYIYRSFPQMHAVTYVQYTIELANDHRIGKSDIIPHSPEFAIELLRVLKQAHYAVVGTRSAIAIGDKLETAIHLLVELYNKQSHE
jgi:ribulose-5-phosphate 4-epimerase/fuculose-1-phosphate aldolase